MILKTLFSSYSTTILTLTITLAVLFINLFMYRLNNNAKKQLPPGPLPWPVIGNAIDLYKNKPTFRWLHSLFEQYNSDIVCLRIGSVHVFLVTCPKISLEFLKEQDSLFASRPPTMASRFFSRGYLTSAFQPPNDQWKKMKKVIMSEMISISRLQWLHAMRTEETDNLVKYVFNRSSNNEFIDLRIATQHYTGNVIRRMIFNKRYFGDGTNDGGPGMEEVEHVKAVFDTLKYLFSMRMSDYFPFLVGLDFDGHEKAVKEIYKIINKFHDPLIDARIKKWRHDGEGGEKKEPEDLLDILITLKDGEGKPLLSVEEIKAQTLEIMMASFDNQSNAVEWTLAEMLNNPTLFQKAIEELDQVVGKERLVQESDIPKLKFLKACARESLRLHPVAPFNLPHMAMADTTVAGYSIPKGSHVLLSRIGLGRNPKVWDEPLKFKPERHLNDELCSDVVLTEPNLRFISFSTGRRGCIGVNLGTIMTIMLLARLVQGFTWSKMPNVSSIDLSESKDNLFLSKPLMACATRRLPLHLYITQLDFVSFHVDYEKT